MSNPPVPTKLRQLRGNPGRRPLPPNEPEPPPDAVIRPTTMTGAARKFWDKHAPVLEKMGCLTPADVEHLAVLCETEAEYWAARKDVRKRGTIVTREQLNYKTGEFVTVTEVNPNVRIASDAAKRLKGLMEQFGMSPAARTRIQVPPKEPEEDPFAQFEKGVA